MRRLVEKLGLEKYAVTQWNMQNVNITTNIKVKLDLKLPTLSTENVMTWKCHVDKSAKARYNMMLLQYL